MLELFKSFLFDGAFARRVIVVTALGAGGFLGTSAGAAATAELLSPEVRGFLVLALQGLGGLGAVQGMNGSAKE